MTSELPMYVVYDHPQDFPRSYVVRRFLTASGEPRPDPLPALISGDLELIRQWLRERGLMVVPRFADDDPVILEVWL
jgi:hypothetical protein